MLSNLCGERGCDWLVRPTEYAYAFPPCAVASRDIVSSLRRMPEGMILPRIFMRDEALRLAARLQPRYWQGFLAPTSRNNKQLNHVVSEG
jgi:hypothetical protein